MFFAVWVQFQTVRPTQNENGDVHRKLVFSTKLEVPPAKLFHVYMELIVRKPCSDSFISWRIASRNELSLKASKKNGRGRTMSPQVRLMYDNGDVLELHIPCRSSQARSLAVGEEEGSARPRGLSEPVWLSARTRRRTWSHIWTRPSCVAIADLTIMGRDVYRARGSIARGNERKYEEMFEEQSRGFPSVRKSGQVHVLILIGRVSYLRSHEKKKPVTHNKEEHVHRTQ
ncbi:hypothetical protein BJ508DRAFT_378442 [Ascobolus immersus RN42]|uniref:Uncharacterized protein n=1 Tax=Ascobolus immersus RN42 TaxID=1160509 RepID=A0A3N4HX29_ASCIM|nr:hypothetical protein BJ508DRAFT_378442 [Ascobolus immersus RN42]